MSKSAEILVVDDEPRVRELLRSYLEEQGFGVTCIKSGDEMRRLLAKKSFDLVLLDLVLPDASGLDLVRETRKDFTTPIIMITGRDDVVDRVVGLELGADDYILKPFHLREVLARVRSVLRRAHATDPAVAGTGQETPSGEVTFNGWTLDFRKRELRAPHGALVALTTGEFDLLVAFVRNPNRPLNRDQLMDLARSRSWTPLDRSIDTQVGRLRRKIEPDAKHPTVIKTVRGIGYLFAPDVSQQPSRGGSF